MEGRLILHLFENFFCVHSKLNITKKFCLIKDAGWVWEKKNINYWSFVLFSYHNSLSLLWSANILIECRLISNAIYFYAPIFMNQMLSILALLCMQHSHRFQIYENNLENFLQKQKNTTHWMFCSSGNNKKVERVNFARELLNSWL